MSADPVHEKREPGRRSGVLKGMRRLATPSPKRSAFTPRPVGPMGDVADLFRRLGGLSRLDVVLSMAGAGVAALVSCVSRMAQRVRPGRRARVRLLTAEPGAGGLVPVAEPEGLLRVGSGAKEDISMVSEPTTEGGAPKLDPDEARQGEPKRGMPSVLVISTVVALVALGILFAVFAY